MMIAAKCRFCGCDVTVEEFSYGDEFSAFLGRMAVREASCQPCGKLHEEKIQKENEEYNERQRQERERQRENDFIDVVGRKYRGCSFDTFKNRSSSQSEALKAARDFALNPSGFLYLHGKPGIGKTHLAVAIYRENRQRATFWTVPELLLDLRSQIGSDVTELEAIKPLMRTSLLILDDLGAEKITDWVRQAFYVVISRRERDELPTVITSNLSLGEIEARVGDERITSRIGGAARILKIEGTDERISGRPKR